MKTPQEQYAQMNENVHIEQKSYDIRQTNPFFEEQMINQKSPLNTIFDDIDACMIKQQTDLLEIFTGIEIPNKYTVVTSNGENLRIEETSECFERLYCGPARGLVFNIYTNNQKILSLERPFAFILPEMYVYDETQHPKRYIGKIQTQCSPFTREYKIFDFLDQEVSNISGNIFAPWTFFVHKKEMQIGKIQKKFSGLFKELFSDSDNFGVTFQKDLSTEEKSLIFSATLLIDLMYFERNKNNN
eukprot:gene11989-5390_t